MQSKINKILISLVATGILFSAPVFAYFNDTETAGATIQAETLDFSVVDSGNFTTINNPTIEPFRNFNLTKTGNLDFKYAVVVENESGDLCSNLNLKDDFSGIYSSLSGFSSSAIDYASQPNVTVTTKMISGDSSWQMKSCSFDLVIKGWQPELDSSHGFVATKRFSAVIQSGKWVGNPGDIVINELMWMGSYLKNKDEWIELKNTTSYDLDISGFQITKLIGHGPTKQEVLMLTIPDGTVIPANGFFLISRFSESDSGISVTPNLIDTNVDLRDADLQIKIYKADWTNPSNLIDTADDGNGLPAAGYEGLFFHLSMERNDIPGNGASESSWHTCLDLLGTRPYWDHSDIFNLGTPNDRNLSDESDADLSSFINREQELLAEKEYVPDLEIGQDDGLLLLSEQSGSSMPPETPLIEEQSNDEGGDEVIAPETTEMKPEEPIVLEAPEESADNNSEQEIVPENQTTDNGAQDSGSTNTDSANTDQNNITSNETDQTI